MNWALALLCIMVILVVGLLFVIRDAITIDKEKAAAAIAALFSRKG